MLKANKGSIIVDGEMIPVEDYIINAGYVPQSIYLLDDSIKNNILVGRDYDEEKLKKCIKISQLETYLEKLPNNFNTIVGEKGAKISGGQIQRIGIARALYMIQNILN